MNRGRKFGGDYKQDLQIGGTGEDNLPRKGLTKFDEEEAGFFLNSIRNLEGDFKNGETKKVWLSSLFEHTRVYCPWLLSIEKTGYPRATLCKKCK